MRREDLRGKNLLAVLAALFIVAVGPILGPLGALLAIGWARLTRTPLRELGFVRPRSWAATIAFGIAFGVALKLVLKAVVMPLLGAPAINPAYHHLVGNTAALPGMMWTVIVGAGFGEETLFRGFPFERSRTWFGAGRTALIATVLVSSAWFAVAHLSGQGLYGALQAGIVGLVIGTIFAVTRELWPLIVAHAAFDVAAVFIIYLDLEEKIAHFFR
jgi:membrane protease YdiL (CAAX protease family)